MRESSKLATDFSQRVAGKVYRAYLYCVARLISENEGTVTAYDGDRIMGIFIGDTKNTNAASCALKISHMVFNVLRPRLNEHFKSLNEAGFEISHCVGIDTGSFLAVRAGQRGANDLVWVGRAPNLAASLSEVRLENVDSFISNEVFSALNESAKLGGEPKQPMWTEFSHAFLGEKIRVYGSGWMRSP